ncbi:hypothetical protein ACRTDU_06530 [Sunxiuqinia elliptica]
MKLREIVRLLFVASLVLFIIPACVKEGPPGLDGADGADGADGSDGADGHVTCLVCHGGDNIEAIQGQFAMSVHKSGVNAVAYAGARASCAACHSHEGFVQYAEFGEVFGNITSPNAWECGTCHGLHDSFDSDDYALRLTDPVAPIFNDAITMDLQGNSNLCANCHQSRRAEPNETNPGEETFYISSTHYGPHHGAQANVVAGVGFAEIDGSSPYPEAGSNFHLNQASCVGCHMAEFSSGQGGHSWIPNVDACNDCHDANLEDYNYGGVQTEMHESLAELRDLLLDRGVIAGNEEDGFHPVVGTYPMIEARAFFNWVGLEEDRSLGVHNPKYVRALLNNSIEALKAE